MIIKNTEEIQEFFDRCIENLNYASNTNEYIGVEFDPSEEEKIKEELAELGNYEFAGDKSTWPSLYISVDDYRKTPYNSHVHLDAVGGDGFELFEDIMPANRLYNIDVIKDDPNKELNDYMVLRAFDKPFSSVVLKQDGENWMSDQPAETITIDPFVEKAHGKVVTFGLGIGYYPYMCLLKDDVESVTIVERSPNVISMFKRCLLPQFPRNDKITIIQGDAFDYFNKEFLDQFDYAFADIWKNNEDGFEMIQRMLENYVPPFESCDFWIEETCMDFVKAMVFYYFNYTANGEELRYDDPELQKIVKKIDTYFTNLNEDIDSVEKMKFFMYDKKTLREIIGTKVK